MKSSILISVLFLIITFLWCEATHLCVVMEEESSPSPVPPLSSCDYTYSIDIFSQEADKYSKSDTTITFFEGNHNLTRTWKWKNVENVIFRANGGSEVVMIMASFFMGFQCCI